MNLEMREEERRYQEAARDGGRSLDDKILEEPVHAIKPREAVVVSRDATVADAARSMLGDGCAVIVEDGTLVGILTERDVLTRVVAKGRDPREVRVGEVMTEGPERLHPDDTFGFALHKMSVGSYRHLPVVADDGRLVGMLTQKQGVRFLVGFFPEAVINQPPRSIEQQPPKNQYGG